MKTLYCHSTQTPLYCKNLKGLNLSFKGKNLGEELLLPSVMLKQDEKIFLDDMTLQELSSSLNVSIRIVYDAQDIVKGALFKA